MLKFTYPEKEDKELILSLCRSSLSGCEAYTFLKINEDIPEGSFRLGKDENGDIKSIVFNNGDEDIKVFGSEFSPLFNFSEKCLMVYEKEYIPDICARGIEGKDILLIYKLISGIDKLSFDDEKRYVLRLKGVNSGLSKVFGIFQDGKLISTASVSSMNEKYALISDVFTHPLFRNNGFAKKCINSTLNFILSKGLKPYLRCEESLCTYYEKAGFSYYGKM